jgi:hypothetical protein
LIRRSIARTDLRAARLPDNRVEAAGSSSKMLSGRFKISDVRPEDALEPVRRFPPALSRPFSQNRAGVFAVAASNRVND